MREKKAYAALQQVAVQENVSVEEVIFEIEQAIAEAMENPDPVSRALWKQIPCKGKAPSALELVAYLAEKVSGTAGF